MKKQGYIDEWICYKSDVVCAKRLTVLPGKTVTIKDAAAYGMIMMQGYGKLGIHDMSAPSMIRFGEMTEDEFFVTEDAAKKGVVITNKSNVEPLVMLKHFAQNPDLKI